TDYRSQDHSLNHAILDLACCKTPQSVYVMLSHIRSITGVAILREFSTRHIFASPPSDFRSKMKRLADLSQLTTI
ncbi:hypothetical protein DACRYDRAFT_41814, partial [Dacryopinax primogenitus]